MAGDNIETVDGPLLLQCGRMAVALGEETFNLSFQISFFTVQGEVKLTLFAACATRKEHGRLVAASRERGDVGTCVCSYSSHRDRKSVV